MLTHLKILVWGAFNLKKSLKTGLRDRGAPDIRLSGWDPVFWAIRQPDIRWPDNGLSENRIPDIRLRILGIT